MADEKGHSIGRGSTPQGLEALADAARRSAGRGLPPVHLWNPPDCGDIGLKIGRNGVWSYRGSPILRPALTRLFSTILRKDAEGYVLVTPVEKIAVAVEDAPFLAVELAVEENGDGHRLHLRTNVDDWFAIDAEHPLRFEREPSGGVKPYARVRGDLWALATRAISLDLIERGEARLVDGRPMLGVASAGHFFVIAPADEDEASA